MTRDEAKKIVCDLVTRKQGCKTMDLIPSFYEWPGSTEFTLDSLADDLVEEGRLIEVEYVLPGMLNYKIKSFLLPAGTDVMVNDTLVKSHGA